MDSDFPKHILALIPNWLGDVVMCTPALRTLHQTYPDASLTVAGRAPLCELLEGLPYIDEFVPIPKRAGFIRMRKLGKELAPYAQDLTVVFPHSFRAGLQAKFTGSKRILGYDRGGRSIFLTDKVPPNRVDGKIEPVYMVWEYLDLLKPLETEYDGFGLDLKPDDKVIAQTKEHIVGEGPLIGFAPGAAFGVSKQWPVDRYAAVANMLHRESNARCVLLTGPGEEATRDRFLDLAQVPIIQCDEGRPTLHTLKATISQLDLLIGNDSGPRHVAIALDIPVVCIMGPTKPVYSTGPYEKGKVLRVDVDCGPCQKPICKTDHRCMTQITPEMAVEAAKPYI